MTTFLQSPPMGFLQATEAVARLTPADLEIQVCERERRLHSTGITDRFDTLRHPYLLNSVRRAGAASVQVSPATDGQPVARAAGGQIFQVVR